MTEAALPTPEELAAMSKLFGLLDESGCRRLLAGARRWTATDGEVICREGEKGEDFFVVLAGTVAVSADDFGRAKPIASLGRGDFFGEMAVLARQPRSATCVAQGEVSLLAFARRVVEDVLEDYPSVREILGHIGLKRTEELLEKLSD